MRPRVQGSQERDAGRTLLVAIAAHGALVRSRTDPLACDGFHQLLHHPEDRFTNQIHAATEPPSPVRHEDGEIAGCQERVLARASRRGRTPITSSLSDPSPRGETWVR